MSSKWTYPSSHPWLTFTVDLRSAGFRTWLLLGEAASKSGHARRTLLRPDVARELGRVYLVRGALASTAIEGNTLTEHEARRVADDALRLPPSKEYLGQEIRNILAALDDIRDEVFEHDAEAHADVPLTVEKIERYNRMVLADLEVGEGVVPGELRTHSVVVGDYRGAPASECGHLLERLCDWLGSDAFRSDDEQLRIPLAIVKAIFAHLYLTWIHPFGDGNGRTARLLEVQVLLSAGFAEPTVQLLSNHYNRTRADYYRQLSAASRTRDPLAFLHYAVRGFVDELRAQIDRMWTMQYLDRWQQYLHECFGEIRSDSERRRLRLVRDLSEAGIQRDEDHPLPDLVPVSREAMRHLSPQLAELYAGKTERTLSRDLNALLERGLIERRPGGYVPAVDQILAFMPSARDVRLLL